jgi:hypothetical protein
MSWGASFRSLFLLPGLLILVPPWPPARGQQPPARKPLPLATVTFSQEDLDGAAPMLQARLREEMAKATRKEKSKARQIPIPAPPGSVLQKILSKLQMESGEPMQLEVRIPEGGIAVELGAPQVKLNHSRGSPDLNVGIQIQETVARASGIQIGLRRGEEFLPLSNGKELLPAIDAKVTIPSATATARVNLPERGTAIKVGEITSAPLTPKDFDVSIPLPPSLTFSFQQEGGGTADITLNENTMTLIRQAAEQSTQKELANTLPKVIDEKHQEIVRDVNSRINEFRSRFSMAGSLRTATDEKLSTEVQAIRAAVQQRSPLGRKPELIPEESRKDSASTTLATLDTLVNSFELAPFKPGAETGVRLPLLQAMVQNLMSDRDHFARVLELDPKNKGDQAVLDKLESYRRTLLSTDAASSLNRPTFDAVLAGLLPRLREFVDEGGVEAKALAETGNALHWALIKSRLGVLTSPELSEDATRLREQVIGIGETLAELRRPELLQSPSCAEQSSPQEPGVRTSLDTLNALLARMHEEGTLNLMMARKDGVRLLGAPMVQPGWKDEKSGKMIGAEQGEFTLQARLDTDHGEFETSIRAKAAPTSDGTGIVIQVKDIDEFDYNASTAEMVIPVLGWLWAGLKDLVGPSKAADALENARRVGKDRIVIDLKSQLDVAGKRLHSIGFDPSGSGHVLTRLQSSSSARAEVPR